MTSMKTGMGIQSILRTSCISILAREGLQLQLEIGLILPRSTSHNRVRRGGANREQALAEKDKAQAFLQLRHWPLQHVVDRDRLRTFEGQTAVRVVGHIFADARKLVRHVNPDSLEDIRPGRCRKFEDFGDLIGPAETMTSFRLMAWTTLPPRLHSMPTARFPSSRTLVTSVSVQISRFDRPRAGLK